MSAENEFNMKLRSRPCVKECLQERSLEEAIEYTSQVQKSGRLEYGFTRFELLVLAARLEEAGAVLAELEGGNAGLQDTCRLYTKLLAADRWRRDWNLNGERVPSSFSRPVDYVKLRCRAWHEYHQRSAMHAATSLAEADGRRPRISGVLQTMKNDTHRFGDIRESDSFICDTLEVLTPDRFVLVPFSAIRRLEFPGSERVRQAAYVMTKLVTRSGISGLAWIPQYYAGTYLCDDAQSRSGQVTTWDNFEAGYTIGYGPRKLQVFCDNSMYLLGLDEIIRIAFSSSEAGDKRSTA